MAQWQRLMSLDSALQDRVIQAYEGKFPREIRQQLSNWIESQNWDSAAADEQEAKNRFHELLVHLGQQRLRSVQQKNILQSPDFGRIKEYLQRRFEENPLTLARILSECLEEEKKILSSACGAQGRSSSATDKHAEFDGRVKELRNKTWEVEKEIKSLMDLNDALDFIQQNWQSQVEQLSGGLASAQAAAEEDCRTRANFIAQTKQMVLQEMVNIVNMADQIVNSLTEVELPEWRRRQQLACVGGPDDTSLDRLQIWFTTAAEALQHVRQQLEKLRELNKKYDPSDDSNLLSTVAAIEEVALSLFNKLLKNALVVEKQPCMSTLPQRPLVLKTGVRFTMKVRFLANLPEFKCWLHVKPEFDKDVKEVKTITGFRQFVFSKGDKKVLDVDTPDGGLVAEFGHLSLKEHKGRTKGSNENHLGVMEELHIIKFETKFQHAGLECNIEASSLPLVIISSTSQIPSAWASVMWCSMLTTSQPPDLSMFLDPPAVTWQQLSEVLSWQFLSVGERGLDEDQLSVLKGRIVDDPDDLVYWREFSKGHRHKAVALSKIIHKSFAKLLTYYCNREHCTLPYNGPQNESAWIWIDGILDLIKKHLKDLWKAGCIMGFVSKATTKVLLQETPSGNFLLRFSDTIRDGAVTFSYVDYCSGEAEVHHVDPYTKKNLSTMSLADSINNYNLTDEKAFWNPLVYLYPNIPKDAVFRSYYSSRAPNSPGYLGRKLICVSDDPTPPPSPPMEMLMRDSDMDCTTADDSQKFDCDSLWSVAPTSVCSYSYDSTNPDHLCPS